MRDHLEQGKPAPSPWHSFIAIFIIIALNVLFVGAISEFNSSHKLTLALSYAVIQGLVFGIAFFAPVWLNKFWFFIFALLVFSVAASIFIMVIDVKIYHESLWFG